MSEEDIRKLMKHSRHTTSPGFTPELIRRMEQEEAARALAARRLRHQLTYVLPFGLLLLCLLGAGSILLMDAIRDIGGQQVVRLVQVGTVVFLLMAGKWLLTLRKQAVADWSA